MVIIVVSLLSTKDNVDEYCELGVKRLHHKAYHQSLSRSSLDAHLRVLQEAKVPLARLLCMSNAITSRRIYAFQRVGNA